MSHSTDSLPPNGSASQNGSANRPKQATAHLPERLQALVAQDPLMQKLQQTVAQADAHPHFQARDADTLAEEGRHLPPLKQVFGNYILESSAVLFPSERGVGKTFFLLQLCLAISRGYVRLLGEPLELAGNTLYVDFEMGERTFQRRLAKLYERIDHPLAPVSPYRLWVINARGSLPQWMSQFLAYLEQFRPVLVVIDNLRTAFRGTDHEKNSAITEVVANLMDLKNEHGFALVVAHHTRKHVSSLKTSSDLQSGAGALTDLFDADFFLRRSSQDKHYRLLLRRKSRFCEESEGAKLIGLNPESLWFDFLEDEVDEAEHLAESPAKSRPGSDGKDEQIAALLAEGKAWREIEQQLGVSSRRIAKVKSALSAFPLSSPTTPESDSSA